MLNHFQKHLPWVGGFAMFGVVLAVAMLAASADLKKDSEAQLYKGDHMAGEIEILEPIVAFQNKYCTVYNDKVLFPNGKERNYLRFTWNGPAGAVVLPVTEEHQVLLFKHFRHATREWALEVPRGLGKSGEDPLKTAQRELFEETGYMAKQMIDLGVITPDSGILASKVSLYLALGCTKQEVASDPDENTITGEILLPYDVVIQQALDGEITDGFTNLVLFRAQKYLK